jgi:hypothetical protein
MMPSKIIDFKEVDMTDEEYSYYQNIVNEFSDGTYSGKEQFHDAFEVDEDGCIVLIKPPLKKQMAWAVIFFLQNLMINQRLRRMERWVMEFSNDRKTNS